MADKAVKKKSKYNKVHLEAWKCDACSFECSYKTLKCPLCSTLNMVKII
ncbi:MAG: hypothetical protein HY365_03025 [Candidatus Aenigmarchaeota archaeon]|nr:hypothetical protein [Candidatus Aenigmarchaeota archaeon]